LKSLVEVIHKAIKKPQKLAKTTVLCDLSNNKYEGAEFYAEEVKNFCCLWKYMPGPS